MTKLNKLFFLFYLPFFLLTSCVTSDSLMELSLKRQTAKSTQAASELALYASNTSAPLEKRCWALRSLSYFDDVPDSVIKQLGNILVTDNSAKIISWTAYTLGHFQRKESIPYLMKTLSKVPNAPVDYYILEALTREISVFNGSTELSLALLDSMNTYVSHTKKTPPTMFNLLDEYVATLATLVLAMENITKKHPENKRDMDAMQEIYGGIYRIFRAIEVHREQLLNDFINNKLTLEQSFECTYAALDKNYQPAFLLYAWYAGKLSANPELTEMASKKLLPWLQHSDPRLRQLVLWALMRMEIYDQETRQTLLAHLATTETDPLVLQMLAKYQHDNSKQDAIQQLLRLQVQ